MASIKFERVNKIYPNGTRAISNVSFEIKDGEFCVFVGPSGCGKSTMLRMIAGLEEVTTGKVYIDGVVSNEIMPKDRDIAMVFQNYALYPHLTVYQNMAFGLQMQAVIDPTNPVDEKGNPNKVKYSSEEIKERVEEAAKILGIENLLSRKPGQLSGGQKQRVALGRALVRRPKLFLLDEPLSNVDAQIRSQMRSEIKRLHQELGVTFIYVTHDQTEAMTMADKIVVMNHGQVMQVGSPYELFTNPQNLFVATFIGTPSMNLFNARLIDDGKSLKIQPEGFEPFEIPSYKRFELADPKASSLPLVCGIRPEDVTVSDKEGELYGKTGVVEFLGSQTIHYINSDKFKNTFIAISTATTGKQVNEDGKTFISLHKDDLHLFLKDTGKSVLGLPEVSYFASAKLNDEGALSINNEQANTNLLDRLYDSSLLNKENVTFGINPIYISEEPLENSLLIKGKVAHTMKMANKTAVFLVDEAKQNIAFYDYQNKEYKQGDVVSCYLPSQHIDLYQEAYGERLTAKWEMLDNTIDSSNMKNIVLPKDVDTSKKYILNKFNLTVSNKHKSGYSKALVLDDDVLDTKSIVYAKFNEQNYISLVVDGSFDRHDSPYIFIKISPKDLQLVE